MRKALRKALIALGVVAVVVSPAALILLPLFVQGAGAQDEAAQATDQRFAIVDDGQPVSWIGKVAEAIKAKSAVTLTADEVQALGQAYAALEQRQVSDIAFSETHVYVVSPAGTVVLSKKFQR